MLYSEKKRENDKNITTQKREHPKLAGKQQLDAHRCQTKGKTCKDTFYKWFTQVLPTGLTHITVTRVASMLCSKFGLSAFRLNTSCLRKDM